MKAYYVNYRMVFGGEVSGVQVIARNKAHAYTKAIFEEIPKKEHLFPYNAWVHSVTYNNGKYQIFNTREDLRPY